MATEIKTPFDTDVKFPLTPQARIALKTGLMGLGILTLVAGTATFIHTLIRTTSVAVLTLNTAGGTPGTLSAVCTDGVLTITSTSAIDTSKVNFIVIF